MTGDNYVKISIRFYSDIFEEEMVETMWATVVNKQKGHYRLDNIPFYAPLIASGDVVFAETDQHEQALTYRRTILHSGNSTIQVVLMDKHKNVNQIRDIFQKLGCISEQANNGYFSMEVPANIKYQPIKQLLDDMEAKRLIGYAEPCLANGHKY